jgi:hypothetical protein
MRLKDGHECWEGLKPRGRGLCKSIISALACRDRVKPRRTSVGIAGSRFKPVTTPQKCVTVITIWLVISVLILNATLQTFLFGSYFIRVLKVRASYSRNRGSIYIPCSRAYKLFQAYDHITHSYRFAGRKVVNDGTVSKRCGNLLNTTKLDRLLQIGSQITH